MTSTAAQKAGNRATLRTAIQTFLGALTTAIVLAPDLIEFFEKTMPGSPAIGYIASGVVVITALSAFLAKVMANPFIDDLLAKVNLNKIPYAPKHAATDEDDIVELDLDADNLRGGN